MLEYLQQQINEKDLNPVLTTILGVAVRLAYCAAIIVAGLFISFALRKALKWFFARRSKKSGSNHDTAMTVINSVVKYAAYLMILFQVLMAFGVSPESVLAVAGVGSIAIGFGAKGLIEDLVTGASILIEKQFRVGDIVTIDNRSGTVEALTMRTTRIRAANGDVHIYPNSTIRVVTNMSKAFKRAIVDVQMPCRESIDRVLALLRDEMTQAPGGIAALAEPPVVLGIIAMDCNVITVRIQAECGVGESWGIERELRLMIRRRFEREGVLPL